MHKLVLRAARFMALAGGAVLGALVVLVCLSVAGRMLNGLLHGAAGDLAPHLARALLGLGIGPITGDFELVEAGIAFSIFAFLPLAQITSAHASVDLLGAALPDRAGRLLRLLAEIAFAGVLILIAVQLGAGMLSKMRHGETTFLLQFPVWWGYAASLPGAVLAGAVGVYMTGVRGLELVRGRDILPAAARPGAEAQA